MFPSICERAASVLLFLGRVGFVRPVGLRARAARDQTGETNL